VAGCETSRERWRLIRSGPLSGARNMALDEVVLVAAARGTHLLRLGWFEPACLSLGAFQPLADVDRDACAAAGIDVVRRPTGGRALLHDGDVMYALAGPSDGAVFAGGVVASCRRLAAALVRACALLGAAALAAPPRRGASAEPSCLATAGAYEIVVANAKVVASAQVRRDGVALQHGSLRLWPSRAPAKALLHPRRAATAVPDDPPALCSLIDAPISREAALAALERAFAETFGIALVPGDIEPEIAALALDLERTKYRDPGWLARR